jgi:hypothetical protein
MDRITTAVEVQWSNYQSRTKVTPVAIWCIFAVPGMRVVASDRAEPPRNNASDPNGFHQKLIEITLCVAGFSACRSVHSLRGRGPRKGCTRGDPQLRVGRVIKLVDAFDDCRLIVGIKKASQFFGKLLHLPGEGHVFMRQHRVPGAAGRRPR